MISEESRPFTVRHADSHWVITYTAMASPCQILIRCEKASEAEELALLAFSETSRIEQKFSRYRNDSVVSQINQGGGRVVPIDDETYQLLRFAGECFVLSDRLFDITSGILRKAWTFDGREVTPDLQLIESLRRLVGWQKVKLSAESITLRPGMEIDLGGVAKEYAVDKTAQMLFESSHFPLMVNFGGDLRAISPLSIRRPWDIGIESPDRASRPVGLIELVHGAVATSGVSYRHCFVKGKRLGHILNPLTGWPVENAPQSVTVLADSCSEAGLLSTTAMLQGEGAESFLTAQGVTYHCIR